MASVAFAGEIHHVGFPFGRFFEPLRRTVAVATILRVLVLAGFRLLALPVPEIRENRIVVREAHTAPPSACGPYVPRTC